MDCPSVLETCSWLFLMDINNQDFFIKNINYQKNISKIHVKLELRRFYKISVKHISKNSCKLELRCFHKIICKSELRRFHKNSVKHIYKIHVKLELRGFIKLVVN